MATALSDGYIYLIEADAGDNQNWLHDPDTIDLDNFIATTEYCRLEMPQQYRKGFMTGAAVADSGGGSSFDMRSERRAYQVLAEGIETSASNADNVEEFCMSSRHTSGASATFVRYYLIIRFAASSYVEFTDDGGTRREYCKGIVTDGDIMWRESKPQTAIVRLNFRSVW